MAFGQKSPVDSNAIKNWPELTGQKINSNNRYVCYAYENHSSGETTLTIKAINGNYNRSINVAGKVQTVFSKNGCYLIAKYNDSLKIITLNTGKELDFTGTDNFKLSNSAEHQVLAFLGRDSHLLILFDLNSGKQIEYPQISSYDFHPNGSFLLFQKVDGQSLRLTLLNLRSGKEQQIWHGPKISDLVWANKSDVLAFTSQQEGSAEKVIYHVSSEGSTTPVVIKNNVEESQMILESLIAYSNDGQRIFLRYKSQQALQGKTTLQNPVIWSYKNLGIISQQPKAESKTTIYVLSVLSSKMVLLANGEESLRFIRNSINDEAAFVSRPTFVNDDEHLQGQKEMFFLVSTTTGKRKSIPFYPWDQSPEGKYMFGDDQFTGHRVIYDRRMETSYDLTEAIQDRFKAYSRKRLDLRVQVWLPEDNIILISDGFDLWRVDPRGKQVPINITNSYGIQQNISFSVAGHQLWDNVYHGDIQNLIVTSENLDNRKNGFYLVDISSERNPRLLSEADQTYSGLGYHFSFEGDYYSKLRYPRSQLLTVENAMQSPNLITTKDFKTFTSITNDYHEKKYNWLTTEIMDFKGWKHVVGNAVVYKPEDFNVNKKYPVLFYYYEEMTQMKNNFKMPSFSCGDIPIQWFVSHGYVVITPDIPLAIGDRGKAALTTVLNLYNAIKHYSWVDSNKIGIGGHSFGGYETNYILAHTNVFAAAYSGASVSDLVSLYGGFGANGLPLYSFLETGQLMMDGSIWEKKKQYIEDSPIFHADKITTPVLIMHNRGDKTVPFSQGMELFIALYRMRKITWLLQYNDEGHTVDNYDNQKDLTIKQMEFFDHYLKGTPAPDWMKSLSN